MSSRDLMILRDLWLFRYLTTAQLSRLHFGHIKLAQRRLRKLARLALVTRLRPGPTIALGDRRWVYRLSRNGARLLAAAQGLELEPVLPPSHLPVSLAYFLHHQELTDFRIWLREACQALPAFSCRFVPAYEEVRVDGRRRRRATLGFGRCQYIPDGVFALDRSDGRSALFLLEVDRGTEPLQRMRGSSVALKLQSFATAFDRNIPEYCELFERGFKGARLLWVVPDHKRLKGVLEIAQRQGLPRVVWATDAGRFAERGNLSAPIWSACGVEGLHALDE